MSKENDPINDRLDKISKAIVFLAEKVSSLEERINKEEGLKKAPSVPIDIPPKPMYEAPKAAPRELEKPEAAFVSGSGAKFYAGKKDAKETVKEEGFEAEIGLKWLGRIGILALIFGVAFFLKYAFENNWIGEAGRVAIGILSGMVLIYLGDYLRQKYTSYASTLTGGGIAVLYLSIYSSFAYYRLIDQIPAFIAMMIITAIGAFLAIRYERINLAVLSILGGFLTPILLSTGANNQIGLFSYMTILNLGVLAISFYRNWQKLNLLGLIATLFLYFGWSAAHYDASQLFLTEAFLTLWFIIYSVAIVSHNILSKKKADISDLALIILNGLAYFGISYFLLAKDYGDYLGFFTVLLAAVYFIFAYVSYQVNSEDKELALFFPGLSIFFLTISAPIQFDGVWVTIAWAVEAVALVMGGFYLKNYAMRFFAWALLGIVVMRLIFIDNYQTASTMDYILIFNKRFLIFMAGVVSFSAVYYLYSKYEALVKNKELKAKAAALFLINFLLLWNLSAEVSVYFSNQIKFQNMAAVYPQCQMWDYDSRGNYTENIRCARQIKEYNAAQSINSEKIKNIQSTETALQTVLWSLYAIGLLAFGIRGKNRFLRLMGIGLFGITIAKAFLYGFMAMQGIYRIVAFIILGALLLAASFAYNKYKEKIKEII
ncbi:DUF2339 domain-containing protein [Patescibacteria group bacterium]|nr:DUF2339 domain-containing protein [Patescibacteria group bacterium]MBU4142099.1 DUF2339 domain-containing protein [Patescibacteria group bacterium]